MNYGVPVALLTTLSGVFLASGLLKLTSSTDTVRTMRELKVPTILQRQWVGISIPYLELACALGLATSSGWFLIAASAVVTALLLVFSSLLIGALLRRETVTCNCFGAPEPVTLWSLTRNLLLVGAALATALGVTDYQGVIASATSLDSDELTWFVMTLVGVVAFVILWRRIPAPSSRGATPVLASTEPANQAGSVGSTLLNPDLASLELVNALGEPVTVQSLMRGQAVLLVFVKPDCAPCSQVVTELDDWAKEFDTVSIVPAVTKTPSKFRDAYEDLQLPSLYAPKNVRAAFGVDTVPSAVLLGTNGQVAAGPEVGFDAIEALVGGIREAIELNRSQDA